MLPYKAIEILENYHNGYFGYKIDDVHEAHRIAIEAIRDSARTVSERPTGEWKYVQYDGNPNVGNWHCSECRHIVSGKYDQKPGYNFCPRCGAKMRGEEE